MSRNRLMLLVAVVASFAVAAAGFFLGVQPQLDRASSARDERATTVSQNSTTRAELDRLKEQSKSLPKMRAELATLQASIPSTASTSSFIKRIGTTADTAGVKVSSITVGDAAAYSPPAATPASGSDDSSTDSTSTDSASSDEATATPAPTATPTTPAAPAITTNEQITSQNFAVIPVSVSVNGQFDQAMSFVKGIQNDSRLFLIDSVSSAAANGSAGSGDTDSAEVPTWTFSGFIYVLKATDDTSSTTSAKG